MVIESERAAGKLRLRKWREASEKWVAAGWQEVGYPVSLLPESRPGRRMGRGCGKVGWRCLAGRAGWFWQRFEGHRPKYALKAPDSQGFGRTSPMPARGSTYLAAGLKPPPGGSRLDKNIGPIKSYMGCDAPR